MNIDDLLFIINRSATLYERFEGKFIPIKNHQEYPITKSRLKKWQELASANNEDKFINRLKWEGYNLKNICPLLGSVSIADPDNLPFWSQIIELYCTCLENGGLSSSSNLEIFIKQEEPLPFEDLFVPFIYIARQKILEKTSIVNQLLSQEARAIFERSLLRKLISISSQTLLLEFSIVRTFHQSNLTTILSQISGDNSSNLYNKFIHNLATGGIIKLFKKYAVLARLLGTTIELWIDFITEFLQRLVRDWDLIKELLFQNQEMGIVSDINIGISDNHQGGKSVIILSFSQSNQKLVYKPKDIQLEKKYNKFLELLNLESPPLKFKPLKVLNCGGYGWVEFAEHLPCKNQEEAKLYFQRSGMLLCLIYLLEATDCNQENIIASGIYPQLIDLETLMHHQYRIEEDSNNLSAQTIAVKKVWKSVLRTLFLPQWMADYDGNSFDVSGLSVESNQGKTTTKSTKWQNINADAMKIIQAETEADILSNKPFLENGKFLSAEQYINDLILGFRQMYQFLLNRKEAFDNKESLLSMFSQEKVRFIFRPTRIYSTLLNKLLKPEFLKDGIDRSLEIDVLSRAFINSTNKPLDWNILASEHQALERLDIPFFTAYCDRTLLELENNQSINHYFSSPSYDSVIDNFQNLSQNDLELQIKFIRSSFYASSARKQYALKSNVSKVENNQSKLTNEELIEEAIKIAETLKKTGIYAEDGSLTWLGMQFIPKAERYQFQVIDHSLYGGNAGIGLFLAALARISGNDEYATLSLASVKNIQSKIKKDGRRYAMIQGIGGFQGISSIAYALHHVGYLLNNAGLQDDAYQAFASITPELIAKDNQHDVMLGAAGVLLAILSLYKKQSSSDLLKLAIICGEHLLTHRSISSFGYKTWANSEGKMLTGFSHGATGIAYALISLYKIIGDRSYLDAAKEAIAYEQSVFVPKKNNWLDFSKNNESSKNHLFGRAWCHGAPGIALGRLAGISLIDDIQPTIDIALEKTENIGLTAIDHLCCGNLGRALILREAGFYLKREELISLSHQFINNVVADSRKNEGYYSLFADLPRSFITPGFMQGISGIGYGLLMFADFQQILPSVLLLD